MDPQIYNFLAVINTAIRGRPMKLKKPDWERISAYAKSHNIVPLVYEGCSKYEIFNKTPIELRNKYFASSIAKIREQILRTQIFLDIYEKLLSAGIKPLLLKGLICRSLYGELADHRPSRDEDIYIKKEDFDLCRNILEQNGFAMEKLDLAGKALSELSVVTFLHKSGLILEVHLSLIENTSQINSRLNSCFENAYEDCVGQELDGRLIYSMSHTKCYLYLFLHFYKHFISYGVGIRQVLDLLLYGEKYYSEIDWEKVEENIRSLSADKLYADLLYIGSLYLDINIKTGFSGGIYSLLLEDIMNAGVFGRATPERRIGANMTISAARSGSLHYSDLLMPKKAALMRKYRLADIKPVRLPALWIKRICRFIKYNSDPALLYKSLRLGRRRIKLLKSYGIIS